MRCAGSVVTQQIFFKDRYATYEGIIFMGVMIIALTLLIIPIYFPMWGGMFCPPREGVVEEDYYLGEFTEEERAAGLADAAMKFAQVCCSANDFCFPTLIPSLAMYSMTCDFSLMFM